MGFSSALPKRTKASAELKSSGKPSTSCPAARHAAAPTEMGRRFPQQKQPTKAPAKNTPPPRFAERFPNPP